MARAFSHFENALFHTNIVRKLLDNVVNILNPTPGCVMDIGCGSGRILMDALVPALPKNFSELVGIDKHHSMIEYCRTLSQDPRISFEQLDITTKEIPKKFQEKFDLITSFFCLHYAGDYNQAIRNIQNMLKPNGELIYIQSYKLHPLYDCYKQLCRIDRWKPFLNDFENFTDQFSGSDRESKVEDIFRKNDLKLLNYEFSGVPYRTIPRQFAASIQALDTYEKIIPEDQREAYLKDFRKSFYEIYDLNYSKEDNLEKETEIILDCLTVHAKKP